MCVQFSKFILGCTEVINFCYHQMSIKGKQKPPQQLYDAVSN